MNSHVRGSVIMRGVEFSGRKARVNKYSGSTHKANVHSTAGLEENRKQRRGEGKGVSQIMQVGAKGYIPFLCWLQVTYNVHAGVYTSLNAQMLA